MKIAIIGASAAGSFAALLLARTGHDVLVLDRENLSPLPTSSPLRRRHSVQPLRK